MVLCTYFPSYSRERMRLEDYLNPSVQDPVWDHGHMAKFPTQKIQKNKRQNPTELKMGEVGI